MTCASSPPVEDAAFDPASGGSAAVRCTYTQPTHVFRRGSRATVVTAIPFSVSAEQGLDDVQVELRREHEVVDVDSLIDVVEAGVVDLERRRADRPDAVSDGAEALAHEV